MLDVVQVKFVILQQVTRMTIYYTGQEKFVPLKIDDNVPALFYINHINGIWAGAVLYNPYNNCWFHTVANNRWYAESIENFHILGYWLYHNSDKFVAGNFFPNTTSDELLCLSDLDHGGLARIYKITKQEPNAGFTELWSNPQSNYIGDWLIRPDDYFKAVDFDGDGTDELLCYNINTHCSAVLKFENNQWTSIRHFTPQNGIGGFIMDGGSDFFVGDFDNYGKQDMLFISGATGRREAVIKKFINNNYWPDMWYNNMNGYINNWYINNNNNSGDRYFILSNAYLVSINTVDGRAQVNKFNCNAIPPPISITTYQNPSIIYKGTSGTIECHLPIGLNPANYTWTITHINIGSKPLNVTAEISNSGVITINYPNSYSDNVKSEGTPVWKLRVTASCFWGEKTIDVVPWLSSSPYVGCPWLIVNQQDTNYNFDNNLLNKSQLPENQGNFITDKYVIKTKPGIFDGKIKLDLVETSIDSTLINSIKLYSVTHPLGSILGVTANNELVYFDSASVIQNDRASLFDSTNSYSNITDSIKFHSQFRGSTNTHGDTNYHIFAEFNKSQVINNPAVISYLQRGIYDPITPIAKDNFSGNLFINNTNGSSQYPFMRRENPDLVITPLTEKDVEGSVDSIHIAWDKSFKIKYAAVASLNYTGISVSELPLVTAFHTSNGDVLTSLLSNDNDYTYISPNAYLNLEFSTTPIMKPQVITDYVVEINGQVIYLGNNKIKSTSLKNPNQNITPTKYSLSQNYPNPFNPVTKINFALPKQGMVTLKIYDVLGREVRTLVNEVKSAGTFSVDFNASEFSSGVYFYRLESNGFSDIKRMMLIK